MSTMLKSSTLVVAALILGTAAADAQSVRAGPRGRPAGPTSGPAPSAAVRMRVTMPSSPRAGTHDRIRHPRFRHGFGRTIIPVAYFVPDPRGTTHVQVNVEVSTPVAHTVEARREPVAPDRTDESGPRPGYTTLAWKPGGITPVSPEEAAVAEAEREAASSDEVRVVTRYVPVFVPIHVEQPLGLLGRAAFSAGCEQVQLPRQDRRRFPWGLGWLHRYGRDVDLERGAVPPSFYLRSPLLSGLYEPPDCPPDAANPVESCAVVTVVSDDDAAIEFDVPLPQLGAVNARELRDALRTDLDAGEVVILRTTDGEEFELMERSVRETDAKSCQPEP